MLVHHGYGTPSHQDQPTTLLLNPLPYEHDHDDGHGDDGGHGYDGHGKPLTIVCESILSLSPSLSFQANE